MKNCLTVALLNACESFPDDVLFEGVDIIKPVKSESVDSFFARCKKNAPGKYILFSEGKFTCSEPMFEIYE